jgi:hypothetical protein
MNVRRFTLYALSVTLAAAALATVPVIAHHSSAPFYDATKRAEAQGPVTKLLLRNPHSFLYFESEVNGKKVEWQVELGRPLTRAPAEARTIIKVSGSLARRSSSACAARKSPSRRQPMESAASARHRTYHRS